MLKIIPIAKPGKYIYDISSYRPISLIPVLVKLSGSLVKDRLTRTIKRLKLIPAMLMGFKTREAATTCVNYILNQTLQNTREGKTTVIGFLDHNCLVDRTLMIQTNTLDVTKKVHMRLPHGCVLSPTKFISYTTK
jgi:hypothetical protein